jgi:hypothetical protein
LCLLGGRRRLCLLGGFCLLREAKERNSKMTELENINPSIYKKTDEREVTKSELDENVVDPIDEREIFGGLRGVKGRVKGMKGRIK